MHTFSQDLEAIVQRVNPATSSMHTNLNDANEMKQKSKEKKRVSSSKNERPIYTKIAYLLSPSEMFVLMLV